MVRAAPQSVERRGVVCLGWAATRPPIVLCDERGRARAAPFSRSRPLTVTLSVPTRRLSLPMSEAMCFKRVMAACGRCQRDSQVDPNSPCRKPKCAGSMQVRTHGLGRGIKLQSTASMALQNLASTRSATSSMDRPVVSTRSGIASYSGRRSWSSSRIRCSRSCACRRGR